MPKKRRSVQAPGQFYGYSIQTTRMLMRLLRCDPEQAVSLEVLDDVAVVGPDGTIAEQVKSGLRHNPISDRSVELWKTLFNWVGAIRNGALASDMRFVLYVAQPHQGSLVRQLNETDSRPGATALVHRLRNDHWGSAPLYPKRAQLPDTLAPFVNGVLRATDDVLARLIVGFELETGSGSPGDDALALLRKAPISEAHLEDVLKYLLGWVKRTVEGLIERDHPAVVAERDFHKAFVAAAKRFDRSESLPSTPAEITEAEVRNELRNRVYVRQLMLIDVEDRELIHAVNDFLRASADRTSWSEQGDVLEPSFKDFADKLQRHWASRKRLAEVELSGRSELDIGRVIHAKCMDLEIQLQGMDVPSYFTPGSYHALAEEQQVGWHPRFETRLATKRALAPHDDGKSDGTGLL